MHPAPNMKKHRIKLIDGTFTLENVRKLLFELLSYKINYHQRIKFSNEERFGVDGEHSLKRITELQREKAALAAWVDALDGNSKVKINCNIKMETISQ